MVSLLLTVKLVMLHALGASVMAMLGAVVITGLVEAVRNRVRSAHVALADALNS